MPRFEQGFEGDDYTIGSSGMLRRDVRLRDINDVAKFCSGAISKHAHRKGVWGTWLSYHKRRDLLDFLILNLYELEAKFDPARNDSFEGYAKKFLPLRIADWYREEYGDSRYSNSSATVVSLDNLAEDFDREDDDDDTYVPMSLFENDDWVEQSERKLDSSLLADCFLSLSEESRWVLENIVQRRVDQPISIENLAKELDLSKNKIGRMVNQLRKELVDLLGADMLPAEAA